VSDIASRAEEAADIALGAAGVAVKAGNKAVAAVPVPDPRSRRSPGSCRADRNRWPKVLEFEQRLVEFDRRQEVLRAELTELRQQRETAPERHALALAGWFEHGEKGERPGSDADALGQAIVTKEAELVAVDRLVAKLLSEKIDFVTKNRSSLRRTAEGATAKARASYEQAIHALAGAREELLDCRSDQVWAELYPSETTRQTRGTEANLSFGLLQPVRSTLGVTTQLPITAIYEALTADAATIAERLTPEQRKELGVGPEATPEGEAMWDSDPRHQEWAAAKRRELNELAQWAMTPAQLRNMAQEMSDE